MQDCLNGLKGKRIMMGRNYYVVSPNVKKNNEEPRWIEFISKKGYACMGYDDESAPKFHNEMQKGDIVIIAGKSNRNKIVVGFGLVNSNVEEGQLDGMPSNCFYIKLEPFVSKEEILAKLIWDSNSAYGNSSQIPAEYKLKPEEKSTDKKNIKILEKEINRVIMETYITDKIKLLTVSKNLILGGAPGTGKTFTAQKIAEEMIKGKSEKADAIGECKLVQFHPAYTYEDFVRGIVAKSTVEKISYEVENKIIGNFAQKAKDNPNKNYVLIIDEINRANLPSVLGELIYALEYRDKEIETMYELDGNNSLVIPKNLYIIGTMNTADRSAGQIDYAIRRRFAFEVVLPKDLTSDLGDRFAKDLFEKVSKLFVKEIEENVGDLEHSEYLSPEFNPEDVWIGHSYFITDSEKTKEHRLQYEIKPLLREYLKDGILKESAKKIINSL